MNGMFHHTRMSQNRPNMETIHIRPQILYVEAAEFIRKPPQNTIYDFCLCLVGFGNQPPPADLLIETVGFQALEDHRVEH